MTAYYDTISGLIDAHIEDGGIDRLTFIATENLSLSHNEGSQVFHIKYILPPQKKTRQNDLRFATCAFFAYLLLWFEPESFTLNAKNNK